jgi:hypothetical protein
VNSEYDTFDDILSLTDAFLMDRATEEDVERLTELLENNETARRMYVDRIDETISLRKWSCSQLKRSSGDTIQEAVEGEFPANDALVLLKDDEQPVNATTYSSHDQKPFMSRLHRHIRTHPLKFSAVGFVATCIAWALFFRVLFPSLPTPARPGSEIVAKSTAPAAVLRLAWKCRWRDGAEVIEQGSSLQPGQVVDIEKGTVEIVFAGGVKVLLEGRTRFVVRGSKLGQLDTGRLFAYVPKSAVGFEVSTPSAAIRDLGTEFGLAVGSRGMTELLVTIGVVAIAPGDLTNLSANSLRVDAGQAVRVSSGQGIEKINDSAAISAKFARLVKISKQPEVLLPKAERTSVAGVLQNS